MGRKRFKMLTATLVALMTSGLFLAAQHRSHEGQQTTPTRITGEVVDLSCYLSHGGRGPSHAKCAQMCLDKGLPMGILTSDSRLYVVLEDHATPDAYKALKKKAAETVSVIGPVYTRNGITGIAVQKVGR